jgi:hypothetical protein
MIAGFISLSSLPQLAQKDALESTETPQTEQKGISGTLYRD